MNDNYAKFEFKTQILTMYHEPTVIVYTYTHTHIYIYTHIYTHTCEEIERNKCESIQYYYK